MELRIAKHSKKQGVWSIVHEGNPFVVIDVRDTPFSDIEAQICIQTLHTLLQSILDNKEEEFIEEHKEVSE